MAAAPVIPLAPSDPVTPPPWVIVLSYDHGLLPLAWQLTLDGCDVAVAVQRARYAKAWADRFQPIFPPGGRDTVSHELATITAAMDRGAVVVTDCHMWREHLAGRPGVWATWPDPAPGLSAVQLMAWVDARGQVVGDGYVVVVDQGAWVGGQGPNIPGAVTTIRVSPQLAASMVFQNGPLVAGGLVRVGLQGAGDQGGLVPGGISVGWHPLYWHAWATAVRGRVGQRLVGTADPTTVPSGPRFSVALPLTIPPWPTLCNVLPAKVELADLPAAVVQNVYWHDVTQVPLVTAPGQVVKIPTAGLDGLVGVVSVAGDAWDVVRGDAVEIASGLLARVPQGQCRVDFGQHVLTVLRWLRHVGEAT